MLLDSEGFMMVFGYILIYFSFPLNRCCWKLISYFCFGSAKVLFLGALNLHVGRYNGDGNDGIGEAVGDDTTLFFLFG